MGNLARDVLFRMPSARLYTFCLLIVRYMLSDKIKGKSALKARTFQHVVRDKVHACYWYRLSMHLMRRSRNFRQGGPGQSDKKKL